MNFLDYPLNEWYEIAEPILNHSEFQKRKRFMHHGTISVYDHVVIVSILAFEMAKKRGLDVKSATLAGLLHDFYETPWMEDKEKKPFFQRHGFTHAKNALNNAKKYFPEYLNPIIEDSIIKHMFPLNVRPPKYRIGWILTLADKRVSLECLHEATFFKALFKGVVK